jgi:hypothetical protein
MVTPALKKPHFPNKIKNAKRRNSLKKKIVEAVNNGLSPREGFELVGIPADYFSVWKRWAIEDLDEGFTGTELQTFIFDIVKADKELLLRLDKRMWDKVDEGDSRIMMYLADNRFGYANRRKQSLELDTSSKGNVEINIVNMTGVDSDNAPIDVDYVENDVDEYRDDSNSAEMD